MMSIKRMSFDEEAVSEVLGSILTLLVTVALFTSVFATVSQLEGPSDKGHVELEAQFENQNNLAGTSYINISHEGGSALHIEEIEFIVLVDEEDYRYEISDEDGKAELLHREESTAWNIREVVSIKDSWNIESTLELMIRNQKTNRIIYETILIDGMSVLDIRNANIEYAETWREYAERGENIKDIKAEVVPSIWRMNIPFDESNVEVEAELHGDEEVLEDEDGNTIQTIQLYHDKNNIYSLGDESLSISSGADESRYRIKITATYDGFSDIEIDPHYIFLNVGEVSVGHYEEKLVIGRVWHRPVSPSHGDSFTLIADVFNEHNRSVEADWKLSDHRQDNFSSEESVEIAGGPAPTEIELEYPQGIEGAGIHNITLEVYVEDDDSWEGDTWKDEISVDPAIMLVKDNIHEDQYEGGIMENTIKSLNLDIPESSIFAVGPDQEIMNLDESLSEHTLTIWMTGNRTGQDLYLAEDDVLDSLYEYIEGDLEGAGDLNGALWVIGSNLDSVDFSGNDYDLQDKLGFDGFGDNDTFKNDVLVNPAIKEEEIIVTMDEDKSIAAYFKPYEYELDINIDGEGSTDPVEGTHTYEHGTEITVEAMPAQGWEFNEWTGDYTGTKEEITITMDEDKSITANFEELDEYDLTINIDGEGTTEPEEGTHTYYDGTEVTVEPIPDTDHVFEEWTGDYEGSEEEITITMDSDMEITANFVEIEDHTLTIDIEGDGSTDPPEGTHTYSDGDVVTVEAGADEGWYFVEWTGDVSSTEEQITITMDENKAVTAWFEPYEYDLDISTNGQGSVGIYPEQDGYVYETEVELIADPEYGWGFESWTGDYESTEKEITITMDEDKSITANFEELDEYDLEIEVEGEGTVEPEEGTHTYYDGTEVTLEAIAEFEGWYFDGWTGDYIGGKRRITVEMDEDKDITTNFAEIEDHLLRIDIEGEGSTDPLEGTHTYSDGDEVNIEAIDEVEGWYFSHWTGDYGGTYGAFEYGVDEGEYVNMDDLKGTVKTENTLVFEDDVDTLDEYLGVGYEAETDQRSAVNSFLYGSITDPGLRSCMAGEVIEWLSNMTTRTGVDVSVTSQRIEPSSPMFMDEININACFRNNGPIGIDISDTVRLVRRHEGTIKDIIEPPEDADLYLEPDGGTAEVSFDWVATELGVHDFLVKADYFGRIDQVNTENNDIRYKNLDVTADQRFVNVQFSTLVVDAVDRDSSEGHDQSAEDVTDSFDRLGHEEEVDYDISNVNDVDYNEMSKYNLVVWVTGKRDSEVFTSNEVDDILDYLEQDEGGNMMFIGENILSFLESVDGSHDIDEDDIDALLEYMGIDGAGSITPGGATPEQLIGQKGNDLGHALRYEVDLEDIDTFDSTSEHGEVLFKDEERNNVASTYDDDSTSTKTVYLGIDLDRIERPLIDGDFDDWPAGEVNTSRENAREELIYTSMWNFGRRDERTELRVTDYDIKPSSSTPETGRGYQISARIENIGYERGTALIRFADGEEHVASRTVTVPGSERTSEPGSSYFDVSAGFTSAEVSWNPMQGGIRPLRVRVDPLGEESEIVENGTEDTENKMMEFNNQAVLPHPVYYFYDDMEKGTERWRHDTTQMRVDGYSPLEFVGSGDEVNTDVIGDWDWDKSGSTEGDQDWFGKGEGVYETDDPDIEPITEGSYYSAPRSYWMPEIGEVDGGTYGYDGGSGSTLTNGAQKGIMQDNDETWYMRGDKYENYVLDFDGEDDYVEVNGVLGEPESVTLSAWVEADAGISGREDIVSLGDSAGFAVDEDEIFYFYRGDGEWHWDWSEEDIRGTGWRFLSITFDTANNELTLYVDGDEIDSFSEDDPIYYDAEPDTTFGVHGDKNSNFFEGKIDDARIYDKPLSQSEIEDLYAKRYREDVAEENLLGWWPMNEGDGDTLYDESDNDNDGTIHGATWTQYPEHYRLDTDQSDIHREKEIEDDTKGNADVSWGMRAWIVKSGGDKEELTDGQEAIVTREHPDEDEGIQYSEWDSPEKDMNPDDSLLIRIYVETDEDIDWTEQASFITEPLGADLLEENEWTVYYYTDRKDTAQETYGTFHWGDDTYNSRIEGISLSFPGPEPPSDPEPVGGATDVSVNPELSVYVEHEEGENMDVHFYQADGTWIDTVEDVNSGERASVKWDNLDHETTYEWYAVAEDDDGYSAQSATWEFITGEFDPIESRDYRFLTSEPFRVGTAVLNFHCYHYGYSGDDGYLGNVRIDYENLNWWLTPGPESEFEDPREGTMIEMEDGDDTVEDGELDQNPVAILHNPHVGEELWEPTIQQDGDPNRVRTLHMQPIEGAVEDFVIIWEDLHNLNEPPDPDGDGDHWVRVTLLEDGRFRIHVFRAEGGFRHDFYIGAEHIYTKPRNAEWSNSDPEDDNYWYEFDDHDELPEHQAAGEVYSIHFQHRYWMSQQSSGGMMYLWGSDDEESWTWDKDNRLYVRPRKHYPGKIDGLPKEDGGPYGTGFEDATGTIPSDVFNGKSEDGTFDWRSEELNLQQQMQENMGDFSFRHIRVVFISATHGEVEDYEDPNPKRGWYIDDVEMRLTGPWYSDISNWAHTNATELQEEMGLDPDHSDVDITDYYDRTKGNEKGHFWMFGDIDEHGRDFLPDGVDTSLYTNPIYLDNAVNPQLTAHFKFNIDDSAGLPPDGFRVEISDDDGSSWESLTHGARAAWNASGTDTESGEAFSGTTDDEQSKDYGWVNGDTLSRLHIDLSGWRGDRVILRFRVFTNNKDDTFDDASKPRAFFIDDVWVTEGEMDDEIESSDINMQEYEEKKIQESSERLKDGQEYEKKNEDEENEKVDNEPIQIEGHIPEFNKASLHINFRSYITSLSSTKFYEAKVIITAHPRVILGDSN